MVKTSLKDFKPYERETPIWKIAEEYGLKESQIIRMDTNVSPYLSTKWLKKLQSKLLEIEVNQYPDTSYRSLVEAISEYTSVKHYDRIIPVNGADEGIEIVCEAFLEPGGEVVISTPTYDYFRVSAEIHGGRIVNVERMEDFRDNVVEITSSISEKTNIIFLCNPNNPTGNSVRYDDLIEILENSKNSIVVVDEAYYEYSGKTFIELTESYDNLVIIRTLSKAFGLAGARIGYIITSKKTAGDINLVRPPNSLSTISVELAVIALRDIETVRKNVAKTIKERERMRELLRTIKGLEVYPSEANFILFKTLEWKPSEIYRKLLKRGVMIRNLENIPKLEKHLRVTISLPEHNNKFLKLLEKILKETPPS